MQTADLAKVDLLRWPHALRKCGLFENVEMTMAVHSFDLGETVMVFQMSPAKGLLKEGLATVVKLVEDVDEYYEVKFRADVDDYDRYEDVPTYERFLDREGSNHPDPDQYIREFNNRIGYKAA